ITCRPPTRSHERAFILCGIAEEPTWPSLKPSVTVSLPAIKRMVVAKEDGAAPSSTSAETASKSMVRGYIWSKVLNNREKQITSSIEVIIAALLLSYSSITNTSILTDLYTTLMPRYWI